MKHTIRLTAMLLALALLTGCGVQIPFLGGGTQESAAEAVAATETPQEPSTAFGVVEVTTAPELQAETTEAVEIVPTEEPAAEPETDPEADPEAELAPPEETEPPAEVPTADLTEELVLSAILPHYFTDSVYDPADPIYFWRAVGYLTLLTEDKLPGAELVTEGSEEEPEETEAPENSEDQEVVTEEEDEDGEEVDEEETEEEPEVIEYVRIPADTLDILVQALFGDYDGQYPSLGEENPLVAWESGEDGEFYLVYMRDLTDYTIEVPEDEIGEEPITLEFVLSDEDVETARYLVTLSADDGNAPFLIHASDVIFEGFTEGFAED